MRVNGQEDTTATWIYRRMTAGHSAETQGCPLPHQHHFHTKDVKLSLLGQVWEPLKKKKRIHNFLKNALPNFSHGARTSHYKMVSFTYAWFVCWISIHQGLPFLPNHPAKCNYICLVYNSFATVSAGAVRTWEDPRPSGAVSFSKYKGKFSKILSDIRHQL